ncbi:hypothetical protein U0070_024539, partial [Myodes glareolus]
MEDSMDMSPLRPQNYLFGCELKADKDYHFKVDNDENEHQLSLRTVRRIAHRKAEAMNYEGSPLKVTLATLKMSVQPTVSLWGFEITPPVVLRLKCGSVPVHISGQHPRKDAELEDEDGEEVKLLSVSGKRAAPGGGNKFPQKKVKLDEDDDDDDNFDDEEAEEKVPVKKSVRDTPAKNAQKSNQNKKDLKPSTPRSKGQESFKKQGKKNPKTPKGPSSVEDSKAKNAMEAKFINYVKNCFRMTEQEAIQDLWQRRNEWDTENLQMVKIPKKNVFPQDPAVANHLCIFKEEKNIVHLRVKIILRFDMLRVSVPTHPIIIGFTELHMFVIDHALVIVGKASCIHNWILVRNENSAVTKCSRQCDRVNTETSIHWHKERVLNMETGIRQHGERVLKLLWELHTDLLETAGKATATASQGSLQSHDLLTQIVQDPQGSSRKWEASSGEMIRTREMAVGEEKRNGMSLAFGFGPGTAAASQQELIWEHHTDLLETAGKATATASQGSLQSHDFTAQIIQDPQVAMGRVPETAGSSRKWETSRGQMIWTRDMAVGEENIKVDSSVGVVVLASTEPLQAHLDDCTLADFGQESHLGQHLDNLLVGLGSQFGALDMDPGALESQPGALDKDSGV